jgi:hypothetical protein
MRVSIPSRAEIGCLFPCPCQAIKQLDEGFHRGAK